MTAIFAVLLTLTPFGGSPPAQAAGRTTTLSSSTVEDFRSAVRALRAGDTLRLRPGVYDIGRLKPPLAKGRPDATIRITAADPARPPEIRGYLIMEDADYWVLTRLKMVATSPGEPALKMSGGRGWAVTASEITGAASVRALTNVAIDSNRYTGTPPSDWQFSFNCVHDASVRPAGSSAGYHNIYVNARGGARGLIARNSLFNAPDGSNIKVGDGGDPRTPGATGVRIENNTMHNASNQVLLFGNIAGISVTRNLFISSRGNVKTGVYIHSLGGDRLRASTTGNYSALMAQSTFALNSPTRSYVDRGNVLGRDPWVNARCSKSTSIHPASTSYGRWATR